MKTKIILIFVGDFFAFSSGISAQDKKENQKNKNQPDLTVVEIQEPPPVIEIPPAPKSANGSLYTDGAANGNLLNDFKARRIGDLVFVDVVETNSAKVASGAKRNRDSGTLGGIVTAAGALPVPGAAVAGGVIGALGTRKYDGKGSTAAQQQRARTHCRARRRSSAERRFAHRGSKTRQNQQGNRTARRYRHRALKRSDERQFDRDDLHRRFARRI